MAHFLTTSNPASRQGSIFYAPAVSAASVRPCGNETPYWPARLTSRTVRRRTSGTPRRVVVDDRRRRAIATELVTRGWTFVMPRPKSSAAKWGNTDARTTWWSGYWKNGDLDLVSTAQPSESDSFKGDGNQPDWRRGGSPASP